MERSLGVSLVSCQVIEIIEQFRLGNEVVDLTQSAESLKRRARLFRSMLRIFSAKGKLSDAIIRCRSFRLRVLQGDPMVVRGQFGIKTRFEDALDQQDSSWVGTDCEEELEDGVDEDRV